MQVIMTFHKFLHICSKFDQIHLGKDQGNSNFTFIQNLSCKAANFEFLNLSPKAYFVEFEKLYNFDFGHFFI
jgi:hypothetical protein